MWMEKTKSTFVSVNNILTFSSLLLFERVPPFIKSATFVYLCIYYLTFSYFLKKQSVPL